MSPWLMAPGDVVEVEVERLAAVTSTPTTAYLGTRGIPASFSAFDALVFGPCVDIAVAPSVCRSRRWWSTTIDASMTSGWIWESLISLRSCRTRTTRSCR